MLINFIAYALLLVFYTVVGWAWWGWAGATFFFLVWIVHVVLVSDDEPEEGSRPVYHGKPY